MSASPSTKRKLITLSAAADYLSVDERTVRRWIADGRLPAFRLGPRGIRLDHADVDGLLRPIVAAA